MKRTLSLLMVAMMMFGLLAACDTGDGGSTTAKSAGSAQGGAVTAADNVNAEQVVKLMYSSELADWNPIHPSSGSEYANWLDTLVEYDYYGMCQPCLAESWEKSEDGLTWTFKIREGVKWQYYDGSEYGENVTAEDWVTTAKWILDPLNTARTADLLFDFVGAEDYYNAMSTDARNGDWSTVGIKAVDTYTLEYTLTKPCPFFLSRLTYNWGFPTNANFLEEKGDTFGTDNTTILYNGAFLVSQWEANSYHVWEANPLYWDKEDIHVKRIERRFNAERSTLAPEALLRGEVTYADIPTTQLDSWMNDPERSSLIRPSRPGTNSYWYLVNFWPNYEEKTVDGYKLDHDQWLTAANNINFRKSLFYGLDRIKALTCYNPYTPEVFELRCVTPYNFCAADGVDYPELDALAPWTSESQFKTDEALAYRDKAIAELTAAGVSFPIVVYMPYQTDSTQVELSVVVSQQLEALLGTDYIKFILEGYPSTDYLNTTRRAGNYSFMLSYWGPDYADPETYTDPFAIGQKYNYIYMADGMAEKATEGEAGARLGFDGGWWKNSVYDQMVAEAGSEVVDLSARYNAFAAVEAWLLEQAYIVPVGTLGAMGFLSSYMNPFESQYAPFGVSGDRYKYQVVMAKPMSTEEYLAGREIWEAERAEKIAAAQAAGIDY